MGVMINRSYLQASSRNLATDLARYGSTAQWRGVYYRGEKIGFTVSQVQATDDGFELQEDGRLQFSLLGSTTVADPQDHGARRSRLRAAVVRLLARSGHRPDVDQGPSQRARSVARDRQRIGSRTETRRLAEPPALMLSVGRRLAAEGLIAGTKKQWMVFDPATMRNAPVGIAIGEREVVTVRERSPIPAFKVDMTFSGLTTTSWITDTGEIVREESPMGLITILETQEQATALAVSNRMREDMLEAAAIVPST